MVLLWASTGASATHKTSAMMPYKKISTSCKGVLPHHAHNDSHADRLHQNPHVMLMSSHRLCTISMSTLVGICTDHAMTAKCTEYSSRISCCRQCFACSVASVDDSV